MKNRFGIPLSALTWAVLLGLVAFVAFLYSSFVSSSKLEQKVLAHIAAEDSLFFASYNLLRRAEDGLAPTQVYRSTHTRLWNDIDSLNASLDDRYPTHVLNAVTRYRAYGDDVLAGNIPADRALRTSLYDDLRNVLREFSRERLSRADHSYRDTMEVWIWAAVLVSLTGFLFFLFLFAKERRRETAYERLASIVRTYGNPVAVYDGEGRTIFANDAALREFDLHGRRTLEPLDRLGHLSSGGNDEEPQDLWTHILQSIHEGSSWTGEVEVDRKGDKRNYMVHALHLKKSDANDNEVLVVHSDITEQVSLQRRAAKAEVQYRSLVEDSPDAIVLLRAGKVEYANRAAVKLFGFSDVDDLGGPGFVDLFGSAGTLAFDVTLDGKSPGDEILKGAEFRAATRKGVMVDVEAGATVVTWKGHLALQATFRDITDRKALEREQALWVWEQDALSEIDKRLVGIVDLGRILAAIVLQVTNLSRAPWAGIAMFSESRSTVRWRAMSGNNVPANADVRFEVSPGVLAILSSPDPIIVQELGDSNRVSLASLPGLSGEDLISTVWLPLRIKGAVEGALAVGYRSYHTFSEREMRLLASLAEKTSIALANAALYDNLLQREQELEALSGARVDAQEEERRRIAREIHDGLGQIMTAIKLNVEILEDSADLTQEQRSTISDVKNLLDNVMTEAREISYNLMPSVLDDFGLAPALQLLGERFSRQTGVKVVFFGRSDGPRLDPRMEVALYRIVQESMNNAVRHGNANLITIQLTRTPRQLRLTVEDNGKGMDESMPRLRRAQGGGMGLAGMRERVNSFNGMLTIDSGVGKGTLIVVELPLAGEKEETKEWQR